MKVALAVLVLLPLVAGGACVVLPTALLETVTVASGVLSFGLVLGLTPSTAAGAVPHVWILRTDALSVVFLLPTAFLYAATACYSVGYLARHLAEESVGSGRATVDASRYKRRFYLGLNLFAWSLLCAPAVDGLALLWIAIEVTTVISALLVAADSNDGATEAAWKYVLIASCGLGIALLATVMMYYAGAQRLGNSYDLSLEPLIRHAHELPGTPVKLAFALAVLGFGTKVGYFPVHTWLPDAHAEAPVPVSALLSGSLLAIGFYAILRYFEIARAALGPGFPQVLMLGFGAASLLIAALYLTEQTDIKRMLAYSSVEHMGILAIGTSFGAPVAMAGVLLHVLAHAVGKGNAFFGAGVVTIKYRSKELHSVRAAIDLLPWSGPLFVISVLALSGLPPFGLFRSEFEIVAGGFQAGRGAVAAVLVALVTLAFFGLTSNSTRPLFQGRATPRAFGRRLRAGADSLSVSTSARGGAGASSPSTLVLPEERGESGELLPGEPSAWMVVPVVVGVVVLLVLGLDPPPVLHDLLARAASQLAGG